MAKHWREYLGEAGCLALFMLSAATVTTVLHHPASPLAAWSAPPVVQRIPIGIAMGLTLVAIVYSPMGRRSGAHMNPALTLTYLRLGKVSPGDAAAYVAAQFTGGICGISAATWLLAGRPAHPSVNFIATVPGPGGAAVAFAAEAVISFGLMLLVLTVSSRVRTMRWTGVCAGILVACYITFEAPLSGTSMNPARTLGPALLAHASHALWIYFTAPPLGMLAAAELFVRRHGAAAVLCAKLHHPKHGPCIFNCGLMEHSA
jgi:aquaporin Z